MPRSLVPITPDRIDPDALKVVRRLRRFDHEAYVVGGSVRDLLVGGTPKDFDIATSATPNEIRRLFRNARIIGRRFRLAHLLFGRKVVETSTFRRNPRDAETEDAEAAAPEGVEGADADDEAPPEEDLLIRRDNVFGTAEEDARRRDFTVNALFYDPIANRVVDYVDGLRDIEAGLIRTIGDPDVRMREDPVRILRAVRFAAWLGFTIEPATLAAVIAHRRDIARCAPPRILEDAYRLLRRGAARASLALLRETGALEVLLPEIGEAYARDEAASERHARALGALDAAVAGGAAPSNPLLLGSLLLPLCEPFADPARSLPPGDPVLAVDAAVRPVLDRLKVPRREVDRFRKAVLAQRRMLGARTRHFRPMAFARREEFPDALALLEVVAAWRGDGTDALRRWRGIAADARTGAPPGPPPGGEGGRRRSRRRGRRPGPDPDVPPLPPPTALLP